MSVCSAVVKWFAGLVLVACLVCLWGVCDLLWHSVDCCFGVIVDDFDFVGLGG